MKTLRLLGYLLVAVLCIGFASCSSDDDEGTQSNLLIGEWEQVRSSGWYLEDGGKESWNETTSGLYVVFDEDHKFRFYEEDYDYVESGTWSISGNKLTLVHDGERVEGTIKELTSSKLVVFSSFRENGTVVEEMTSTYRKVK